MLSLVNVSRLHDGNDAAPEQHSLFILERPSVHAQRKHVLEDCGSYSAGATFVLVLF